MKDMDAIIRDFDKALRAVSGVATSSRACPAHASDDNLSEAERSHSAGLMRVNHVGEICAQALYDAQGRFSKRAELKAQFEEAGREEQDHLAWTAQRLQELGSRPSLLNPLWYAGAYAVGALAAKAGDAYSLGFVVETERQVEEHLASHLKELPAQDRKSRAIVDQMRIDEIAHGAAAQAMGASNLPAPIRGVMKLMARMMTRTAYYI